ncbi:MAG: TonB-dependent receptor [Steroidobacteraceae bacterium]
MPNQRSLVRLSALFMACGSVFQIESAGAADTPTLEEIVVTAMHRDTLLKETPIAVSALTTDEIEELRITNIGDVQLRVPGLTFTSFTHAESYLSIRGTGIGADAPGSDLGVSVFIDGVPATGIADNNPNLFDLQDIEVLRGPQGTLFGRNVTGGAVLIQTTLPSREAKGKVELTYGDHALFQTRAMITGPLTDSLAGKLTGNLERQDGNVRNFATGHYDNSINDGSLRGQLLWTPTQAVKAVFSADYTRDTSSSRTTRLVGNFQPSLWPILHYGPDVTNQSIDPVAIQTTGGLSAKVDWEMPFATLTSISGFRAVDSSIDYSSMGDPIGQIVANQSEHDRQLSQEFRLASLADQRLTWIAGLFYLNSDRENDHPTHVHAIVPGTFISGVPFFHVPNTLVQNQQVTTSSMAAYASATYALLDQLKLTVGARESIERKSGHSLKFDTAGFQDYLDATYAHNWSSFTPQANLSYQISKDFLTYATVATGFKSGGYDITGDTVAALQTPFSPEKVTSYEIGAKSTLLNRRLEFDLAAYRANYKSLQVISYSPGALSSVTSNAGSSLIQGVELEGTFLPTDGVTLGASYNYTDAKYDNFVSANDKGELTVYSGNQIPYVAKNQLHLSASLSRPLGSDRGVVEFGADVTYRSAIEFNDANSVSRNLVEQSKYKGLTNAHLSWESADKHTRVALWAKNFTDTRSIISEGDFKIFYATPAEFFDPNNSLYTVNYTPARTFGITLSRTF